MRKRKSKQIHKPLFFYNEFFRSNFWISRNIPFEDFKKSVLKYMGVDLKNKVGTSGCVYEFDHQNGSKVLWMWLGSDSIVDLAHECMHAVFMDLEYKGVKYSVDSEETYCYYLSILMDIILKETKWGIYGNQTRNES